ncbi:MAG: LysR substrate-binding domain-containing protein [Alphaproteobacteria bacterium]
MHLDLTDLRLFAAVVDAGSITAGAAAVGLSLAAASQRIAGAEAEAGAPLLLRGRRGVRPTAAGEALATHARAVLTQMARLADDLGRHARGVAGRVRLYCNTSAHAEFVPAVIAPFLLRHPGIDVVLEERPSADIAAAIAEGRADIGVVAEGTWAAGLTVVPFRRDRLVLAVPKGDALAGRRRVALADIADRDFVGLAEGSALQAHVGGHARRAGRPLRLRVRVAGFPALCRMVADGVGIAVLPESAARRCRRSMAIAVVGLSDPWAIRRLSVCVRDPDALPAAARRLFDHLRKDVLHDAVAGK